MFLLDFMTGSLFASSNHVFIIVATTWVILPRTNCSRLPTNEGLKTQRINSPSTEAVIKSREKRQLHGNNSIQDDHKYYTSLFVEDGGHLWTDLRFYKFGKLKKPPIGRVPVRCPSDGTLQPFIEHEKLGASFY